MPRIPLIRTKDDVPPQHHAAFDELVRLSGSRGALGGPSHFLMHSPKLNVLWSSIINYYRTESPVTVRQQEVAILATVRERHSAYPWGQHVIRAREAGVPEAGIAAVRGRTEVASLDADNAAIVSYAQQLMRADRADQAVFDTLMARFGTQWLVELTLLIAVYSGTSTLLNAFGMEPAPGVDLLPD